MPQKTSAPGGRLHQVPTRPGHLRGRERELDQLDALLATNQATAITPALTGQGGIGKTQFAALYAHDRGRRFEGGIFWLTLAVPSREAIIGQLVTFARACGITPGETGSEERQDRALAERWLGSYGNQSDVLLILDNLEAPRLLTEPLPGLPNHRLRDLLCRKLVTSRRDDLDDCALIRLDSLPVEIARAVLLEAAGRSAEAAGCDHNIEELLSLLGGLPLALRLAGALLAKRSETGYARLAEVLRGRGAREVLDASGIGLADYRDGLSASLGAMLAETWSALPSDQPELARIVQALAQLEEAQTFPAELIKLLVPLSDDPLGLDQDQLPGLLRTLQGWNLIERPSPDTMRLHPLIRDYARRKCGPDFLPRLMEEMAHRLEDARTLLALEAGCLEEIACPLETLSDLHGGSGAAVALAGLCRLLRAEAHALSLTADPASRAVDPAQLAYAAALHGRLALKATAEEAAREKQASYLRLRWTTAESARSLRHRLRGHAGQVRGCAISADGRTGLSASEDQTLIVWNLATGEARHRLRGHEGWVRSCAISGDGQTGLSASADRTLIVWDLATGQERYRLRGHEGGVRGCAISADGHTGLSASSDQTLIVWDLKTGEARHRLRGHKDWVWACAVSADGGIGLSASDDQTLVVWDLTTGQASHRLRNQDGWIRSCGISADGRTGLSALSDQTLIVWDLETGEERHRLRGHDGVAWACAVSADGHTGFSGSDTRTLIVWDLATGEERHRLRGHEGGIRGCAISADGRTGLSASEDQSLIVWDLATDEEKHRLRGHQGPVLGSAVSADGQTGLSASDDQTLVVWDLATGEERRRLRGHEGEVQDCALSADGRIGLSASDDRTLIVWDVVTGEGRHSLRGHERGVRACAISADGRTGLSASEDQTVIVWELEKGEARHRLRGHEDRVWACAMSSDGRIGLSASEDRTLIVWDLATGEERHRLRGHADPVSGCAVTADGRTGLSASELSAPEDQTLIVWDLATGKQRHRLHGHEGGVLSCAVSADGRNGLSASWDRTLIFWDLASGNLVHRLAIDATADSVALEPNGRRALVGDRKGNVTCFEAVIRDIC